MRALSKVPLSLGDGGWTGFDLQHLIEQIERGVRRSLLLLIGLAVFALVLGAILVGTRLDDAFDEILLLLLAEPSSHPSKLSNNKPESRRESCNARGIFQCGLLELGLHQRLSGIRCTL